MPNARRSTARSNELAFIANQSTNARSVMVALQNSPLGGVFSDSVTRFEWGNIRTLVDSLPKKLVPTAVVAKAPRFIYHLDRLGKTRLSQIERQHRLAPGVVSGGLSSSKADVLIVDEHGKSYLVSVKDRDGVAKLGQVSKRTTYGKAYLDGGLVIPTDLRGRIPTSIQAWQTCLTGAQFAKANPTDRKLAYLKKNYTYDWQSLVDDHMKSAATQVQKLCQVLCEDRKSFIAFLGTVLAGNQMSSKDFYIVMGREVVNVGKILQEFNKSSWRVKFRDDSTRNKKASIISVYDGRKDYQLTRIEHSFEGAKPTVTQTKGIIFHFQEVPTGMSYKQLLLDLA